MNEKTNGKNKSLKKFWIIIVCSMIVGGVLGFASSFLAYHAGDSIHTFRETLIWCSPYMMIAVNIVLWIAVAVLMRRSGKLYASWDQEEESVYEEMEKKAGIALGITSVDMILTMVTFGICLSGFDAKGSLSHGNPFNLSCCVVFIIIILIITFVQRRLVEFCKKINPEMRGDALDTNFQKTWIESCDELQRQQIYKAAYKAYASSNILFPVLMVILMVGQLNFSVGIMPIVAVGVVWLVQTVIYVNASIKNEVI